MTETTRKRFWNTTILLPVFIPAFFFILLLVIGTASQPDLAGELFSSLLAYIPSSFGWFYLLAVAIFLVFVVIVALSRWGNIKLGPGHSEPQYSFPAWSRPGSCTGVRSGQVRALCFPSGSGRLSPQRPGISPRPAGRTSRSCWGYRPAARKTAPRPDQVDWRYL